MRVLYVHNSYRQSAGEDIAVATDIALLRQAGHTVSLFQKSNADIDETRLRDRIRLAARTSWSASSYADMRRLLLKERAQIVHFHNTFPLISPAAYYACARHQVPVVQTLHNYRLLCPAATMFRDGHACDDCVRFGLGSSVRHACYRNSRSATAATAAMLFLHKKAGTWAKCVDLYIALTDFARGQFVRAGLNPAKIRVRTNFVNPDPGERRSIGDRAIYVGRLTVEKGIRTLLAAYETGRVTIPLDIIGDGPLRQEIEQRAQALPDGIVRILGQRPRSETMPLIRSARVLVFPSIWYEGLPMSILEAFACGVPVIASRLGAMAEIVRHDSCGLLFEAGNHGELVDALNRMQDESTSDQLGKRARREFEARYGATRAYASLLDIYATALGRQVYELEPAAVS